MPTDVTPGWGQSLLDALRREDGGSLVTGRLTYAQIQALKVADRDQAVRLFHGSDYELLQSIRRDAPEEVARRLASRARCAQHGNAALFVLMGLALGGD
jgi:hypothetical protein